VVRVEDLLIVTRVLHEVGGDIRVQLCD